MRTLSLLPLLLLPTTLCAQEVRVGEWSWSLPNASGPAKATVQVLNYRSGGQSGSLALALKLCTQPWMQGGHCYEIARVEGYDPIPGGFNRRLTLEQTVDLSAIPAGSYHVVVEVSEYVKESAGSEEEDLVIGLLEALVDEELTDASYVVRNGATASKRYTAGARVPPPSPRPAPPPPATAPKELSLMDGWGWSIPNASGTAKLTARVMNTRAGGKSGSLALELWLTDQAPSPQSNGSWWKVCSATGLDSVPGGYNSERVVTGPFDATSLRPASYYVVATLQEYTGRGETGYELRDYKTSSTAYVVRPAATNPGPGPATVANYAGWWQSTYGPVQLTQNGATLSGTYGQAGQATGRLKGNVRTDGRIALTWIQNDGRSGKVIFTPQSGSRLSGSWGYNESFTDGGSWDLWR